MQQGILRETHSAPTGGNQTAGVSRTKELDPVVDAPKGPNDPIDPPVQRLVDVLNSFPGIETFTSCGGHQGAPEGGSQAEEGCWYVDFHVERSDEGWISLEFFAWLAYDVTPPGVQLRAFAKPPYLNFPGQMLFFRWAGSSPDAPESTADAMADLFDRYGDEFFAGPVEGE
jgi:hypothetical protein